MGNACQGKLQSDGGRIVRWKPGAPYTYPKPKGGFTCPCCMLRRSRAGFMGKDGTLVCVPCVRKHLRKGKHHGG